MEYTKISFNHQINTQTNTRVGWHRVTSSPFCKAKAVRRIFLNKNGMLTITAATSKEGKVGRDTAMHTNMSQSKKCSFTHLTCGSKNKKLHQAPTDGQLTQSHTFRSAFVYLKDTKSSTEAVTCHSCNSTVSNN